MNISEIDKRLATLKKEKNNLSIDILKEKIKLENFMNEFPELKLVSKLESEKIIEETKFPKDYLSNRDKLSNVNQLKVYDSLIKDIPVSNGTKYFTPFNVKIGIVADEFLYNSFKDIANFIYITKTNYKQYAKEVDFLFVASTWSGIDGSWKGIGTENTENRRKVLDIIKYYKDKNIKTVFYSKEDPVNYEFFIEIAKECEYIFTTAREVIDDYIKDCKNEKVYLLEFGVNPLYHNPVGFQKVKKIKNVFFAGSWMNKYPDRCEDGEMILDGVINSGRGIDLVDRNYKLNNPKYFYPEKYLQYLIPSIEHEKLMKVHKLYDWSINLNSVKFSQTMFANRIYELQAIGNLILSNYSVGVNNKFPAVFLIDHEEEVKSIINSMNSYEIYESQVRNINYIMSNHTTFNRFEYLLDILGIDFKRQEKSILVVCDKVTPELKKMYDLQTYKFKQLVTIAEFDKDIKEKFDMITFFSNEYCYEEYYLEDMINAFKYTNSDFITRDSYFNGLEFFKGIEHDYVNNIKDKYVTVFWSKSFEIEALLSAQFTNKNYQGYSIDYFEFNKKKDTPNKIKSRKDYKLSVIIPVYNNGMHLRNKCFNSLKRSSLFDDMEIIIVDDGSTDSNTLLEINRLDRKYSNVKTYFFHDGGSGSASRPRNMGHKLSTTNLVTYLDPDNEAINDGYYKLYQELVKDPTLDLVIGNMPKLDNFRKSVFDYYNTVVKAIGTDTIYNTKDALIKTNMQAQSIQALMFRKELLEKYNLEMVEKAGGEDTLFFQELLLNSEKAKVIDEDIHIYYATVEGSVTNSISTKFFEKFYLLEEKRVPFLVENDLMDVYMNKRFEYYFKHWYMKRFNQLNSADKHKVGEILYKIYKLYLPYGEIKDNFIKKFISSYKKNEITQMEEIAKRIG